MNIRRIILWLVLTVCSAIVILVTAKELTVYVVAVVVLLAIIFAINVIRLLAVLLRRAGAKVTGQVPYEPPEKRETSTRSTVITLAAAIVLVGGFSLANYYDIIPEPTGDAGEIIWQLSLPFFIILTAILAYAINAIDS